VVREPLNSTRRTRIFQALASFLFSALGYKLGSNPSPQGLQSVQLFIAQFRAAAHPGVREFVQPFLPIARDIDLGAGTGNAPASVQCLKPIHYSRQISADGLITAPQFAQPVRSNSAGLRAPTLHVIVMHIVFDVMYDSRLVGSRCRRDAGRAGRAAAQVARTRALRCRPDL
jgi:hypothetical protein